MLRCDLQITGVKLCLRKIYKSLSKVGVLKQNGMSQKWLCNESFMKQRLKHYVSMFHLMPICESCPEHSSNLLVSPVNRWGPLCLTWCIWHSEWNVVFASNDHRQTWQLFLVIGKLHCWWGATAHDNGIDAVSWWMLGVSYKAMQVYIHSIHAIVQGTMQTELGCDQSQPTQYRF